MQLKTLTMKTKITLLIAFVSFSFTSCVKDYIGHGSDKIELTEDNNIYEGDLYLTFLEAEIEILDKQIKELEGSQDESLDELKEKRAAFSQELNSNLVPDFLFKRIPRPTPPCPQPLQCSFVNFDFITSLNSTKLVSLTIVDANGEAIGGTTGEQNTLLDSEGRIIVDTFKLENYKGQATIEVITEGGNRLTNTYVFQTVIQ